MYFISEPPPRLLRPTRFMVEQIDSFKLGPVEDRIFQKIEDELGIGPC